MSAIRLYYSVGRGGILRLVRSEDIRQKSLIVRPSAREQLRNGKTGTALPPRRLRMNRQQRLQSAKSWIASYRGRCLARGYRTWFGVDWHSAFTELALLGYPQDPARVDQVLESARQTAAHRRRLRQERAEAKRQALGSQGDDIPSDEVEFELWDPLDFVAGYIESGAPYGITSQQMAGVEGTMHEDVDDEDLPF